MRFVEDFRDTCFFRFVLAENLFLEIGSLEWRIRLIMGDFLPLN